MKPPLRSFKLREGHSKKGVAWLRTGPTYFGRFLAATRQVRVYSPDPSARNPYLDLPFTWMIPVHP
jgi:hypothetical protein